MEELKTHQPDQVEIHAQAEQKKELKRIGHIRLKPGQKLWQMDVKNRIISLAEYEEKNILTGGDVVRKKKLIVKEGFLYAAAINAANADKHFIKQLTGLSRNEYLKQMGLEKIRK